MVDLSKRRGYFIASIEFLKDFTSNYINNVNPFQTIVIFHTISNFMNNTIEYYGYSPLFDEIEDDIKTPEYKIVFVKQENGSFELKVERK